MITLITGPTHVGKTVLAHQLMLATGVPYLSQDHLKMGLIRSGQTLLTPMSPDDALTAYLWPICAEMIKTGIENQQSLILEGCYIPPDWVRAFESTYLDHIQCAVLLMTADYINDYYPQIIAHRSTLEQRDENDIPSKATLLNAHQMMQASFDHAIHSHVIYIEAYDQAVDEVLNYLKQAYQ